MSRCHCIGTATAAIKSVDPADIAGVDLNKRKASAKTKADPNEISAAFDEAGYLATYRTA